MDSLPDITFWDSIEWISVILSLSYIWLVSRENILCWPIGILSSVLSILLFIHVGLYSESILYFVYVLAGVYGWIVWAEGGVGMEEGQEGFAITNWKVTKIVLSVLAAALAGLGLGVAMDRHTDASNPWIDAQTTALGLLATYLEIHKILFAWILWGVINGTSIWLYISRGLSIYAVLMLVYFALSFAGYWRWNKRMKADV